jgi:hypothetical protein
MDLHKLRVLAAAVEFASIRFGADTAVLQKLRDLVGETNRFHLVYLVRGDNFMFITTIPWADDGNHGLPNWIFDDNFFTVEVNIKQDTVEWVPAMGPAPCWEDKFSKFNDAEELFKALRKWGEENY